MPLHLVPVFYAMAVAVTDLSILVGGMIAHMQHEVSQNSSQLPEKVSQEPEVMSEDLMDTTGHFGQELDKRQASILPAVSDVEPVNSEAADSDTDNDNDTDSDTASTLIDQSEFLDDTERQAVVASNTGKVVPQPREEGEDQAFKRLSARKRRASSIASSLESVTSRHSLSPTGPSWTGKMIESSPVASGSRISGDFEFFHIERLRVHEEEPASKKPHVEASSGVWVKKVRSKFSGLRPSKYSRRFRKQITPFPSDRDIYTF